MPCKNRILLEPQTRDTPQSPEIYLKIRRMRQETSSIQAGESSLHMDGFSRALIHAALTVHTEILINNSNAIFHGDRRRRADVHTRLTASTLILVNNCYHINYPLSLLWQKIDKIDFDVNRFFSE